MTTEVSITINDLGNVSCCTSEAVNAEIPLDDIRKDPSTCIFVFQDPHELKKLFEHLTPETVEIRDGMRKLRLKILHPISGVPLTLEEKHGYIEGPHMSRLVQSWRTACRAIPRKHGVEEIIFDMSCDQGIKIAQVVRLLQHISTTMSLKARGTFGCQVKGCESERIEWLKRSLVGIRAFSNWNYEVVY
ncbi:hypothetical protein BDV32DRAFT_146268 [Aspergillus pseudonomiae]|uniref:Uncharacterized protein n=1 Tax=Aspergillus pseudonomiae TaxID=1506151 RepID=A0A5N7DA29_9EURO|nr:uncharacterized protein BDV37DRAFT_284159 [Aspergillus pseudonomiae]KAB8263967.1 hypothetical protein BDV32DRAFT_146268 [Aspergillus pseudonomiae]KAE8403005.1 hypothetical protein BDV37DRAFT_284159 [Aspergillus pseudonomiae]